MTSLAQMVDVVPAPSPPFCSTSVRHDDGSGYEHAVGR
jgi:hypothetical protein